MVDGDCLMPPRFVGNHIKLAEPNAIVAGGRYLFGKDETDQLLSKPFDARQLSYRSLKFCSLPLGPIRDLRPQYWKQARTCNLGLWRSDALGVNGFDEAYVGWGKEDSDFIFRLINERRLKIRSGRLAACVGHFHHRESSRLNLADNEARLFEIMGQKEIIRVNAHRSVLANL